MMRVGNRVFVVGMMALLLSVLILLCACGGGGDSKADVTGASVKIAGNWQMQLQQVSPPSPAIKSEAGFLTQSGDLLSGNVLLSADTLCPGLGTLQGKIKGSNVDITVAQVAQTITLTGTATPDGSTMSGDYTIIASGCGNGSTSGTWTGTQVKPVSGNYQATFTSGEGYGTYDVAIQVSQDTNPGASTANLTGTATSDTSPCGKKLSVSGVIGGTAIVFNFLAEDGTAVGQFRGTTSTDATTLTGTYDFLAQDQVCSGDAGTIVIAQSAM